MKVKQSRYRPQQAQRVDRGTALRFPNNSLSEFTRYPLVTQRRSLALTSSAGIRRTWIQTYTLPILPLC
jgi:hypothetical protein